MEVNRRKDGSLLIEKRVGDILYKQTYYYYTVTEAKAIFGKYVAEKERQRKKGEIR
jgi:hypothetical protein